MDKIIYKVALSMIPGIGPLKARKLMSYIGSLEDIFLGNYDKIKKFPGLIKILRKNINDKLLSLAQKEVEFANKHNIKILFYLDEEYPERLKNFEDSPVVIFVKGNAKLNNKQQIAIVGTRSMTHYGESNCKKLIENLKSNGYNPLIVSGLAYGVDSCAHSTALSEGLETIAILGHGLNMIYPAANRSLAEKIIKQGALITEFTTQSKREPSNFVRRNRIIAALSDAVIVVESAKKGGSLLTAEYAVGYSKDVYTFPGRVDDKKSEGCNYLIKTNRAAMIENSDDLINNLNWKKKNVAKQAEIFPVLNDEEKLIVETIKNQELINIDVISYETKLPINKVMAYLFNLEFNNIVKALPGRMYKLA